MAVHDTITNEPEYYGLDVATLRTSDAKLLHVTPGRTEWEVGIAPCQLTTTGNLHAGVASIILDNLTSVAPITLLGPDDGIAGHLSRTIIMTYLRPVPTGTKVRITCEAVGW